MLHLIVPQFEHIGYLGGILLLIPLMLLFIYVLHTKQQIKKALGDQNLIERLTANYSPNKYRLKFYAVIVALLLLILSAANLRMPLKGDNIKRAGIDVLLVLDVSKSMLSQDIKPNRLDKSKQLVNLLIDKIGNNRMGLVLFAGQAYLQMPLTNDASAAKMYVSNATPDAVPVQGTAIGDALQLADVALNTKEKKYKAVILITDGEDHDSKAIDQAKLLAEHGAVIFTVGAGTSQGSPIMEEGTNEFKKDNEGRTIITKLNEPILQDIATVTSGEFYLMNNTNQIATSIMAKIDNMEKKNTGAGGFKQYQSLYMIFVLLALGLLVAEYFITERKTKQLLW